MTPYTVVWTTDVQNDFTDYWVNAEPRRRQIATELADLVDRELSRLPERQGDPVPGDPKYRVVVLQAQSAAVKAVFEILPADRIVRVVRLSIF